MIPTLIFEFGVGDYTDLAAFSSLGQVNRRLAAADEEWGMGRVVEGLPIVVYEMLSLAMNHVNILKEGSIRGPLALLFPVWMCSRGFQNKSNKKTMKNEKKKLLRATTKTLILLGGSTTYGCIV